MTVTRGREAGRIFSASFADEEVSVELGFDLLGADGGCFGAPESFSLLPLSFGAASRVVTATEF